MDENIEISKEDLAFIRTLEDFDLKMLLSEINDHGWEAGGKRLLPMIRESVERGEGRGITE
jgi:hypothetical protein